MVPSKYRVNKIMHSKEVSFCSLLFGSQASSSVELEENDVSVFHNVIPPLLPVFSSSLHEMSKTS